MRSEIEIARVFANSLLLKTLIFFRLVTSGSAILCMIVLELNRKKFVAHKSLKILLNFHGFWTFLLCLGTFVTSAEQAYVHINAKDPSSLLMTSNQCLTRMIPIFFGICGSVTSLLVMSAERFVAFRNLSTYETTKTSNGIKFTTLHISLTLFAVFGDICMYNFPTRVAHCTVVSVDGRIIQSVVTALLFYFELFTIFFYIKLLKKNSKIHNSVESRNTSLSERYQLSENIRILHLLLPVVISHTSITMAGALGFFYFELAGFEKELYPIFEDTINMVYLQGIAMPLIFYIQYRKKRKIEMESFATNMSSGAELIAVHDKAITKGW